VLDEPNSNLDDQGEQALARCLQGLRTKGVTTIMVTHRPSALALVDRIMILTDGRIALFDTRDKVLEAMRSNAPSAPKPVAAPAKITPIS